MQFLTNHLKQIVSRRSKAVTKGSLRNMSTSKTDKFPRLEATPSIVKPKEEWMKALDADAYYVTTEGGTERPWTGKYNDYSNPGTYKCIRCHAELFSNDNKFDSGCGWPSFDRAIDDGSIRYVPDHSMGRTRLEVRCKNCEAHLGHVFDDGPKDTTGIRYCINSVAVVHNSEIKE